MIPCLYWIMNHLDRILACIAIVIATYAIMDVRHLFRTTQERARTAVLRELNNYGASMAAFFLACHNLEFHSDENKESAALLFATFRVQQLLSPKATGDELAQLRKATRRDVGNTAQEYKEQLISSGMASPIKR